MDSAREAGIQRGGKTKSGAWKRFLLNPFGRVGNTTARLSGKKKKKKGLGILFFGSSSL